MCYTNAACNVVPPFGRACGACCKALQEGLPTFPSIHSRVLKDAAYSRVVRNASELASSDPSITASKEGSLDICNSAPVKDKFHDEIRLAKVSHLPGYDHNARHYTNKRGHTVRDARGWSLIRLCSTFSLLELMTLFRTVTGQEARKEDLGSYNVFSQKAKLIMSMVDCMWPVIDKLHSVIMLKKKTVTFYSSHLLLFNVLGLPVKEETILMERLLINEQRQLVDMRNSEDTHTVKSLTALLTKTRGNIYAMERAKLWARDPTQKWNELTDEHVRTNYSQVMQHNARVCNRVNNLRKKGESWPAWTDLQYAIPEGGAQGSDLVECTSQSVDSNTWMETEPAPLPHSTSLCGAKFVHVTYPGVEEYTGKCDFGPASHEWRQKSSRYKTLRAASVSEGRVMAAPTAVPQADPHNMKKRSTKYEGEQSKTSEVMDDQLQDRQWHAKYVPGPYDQPDPGVWQSRDHVSQKKVGATTFGSNEVAPRYQPTSRSVQGRTDGMPLDSETINTITRALTMQNYADNDGRGRSASEMCESKLTQALTANPHASYFQSNETMQRSPVHSWNSLGRMALKPLSAATSETFP